MEYLKMDSLTETQSRGEAKEMSSPIIELSHVDAGYPGAVILHDVSFEVKRGEVFILLGGSGCGKSTVMKHMIGLNPVLAGTLRVAGMEWSAKTRDELFHKIGVMYQSGALFGSMTCLENVMLPLEEFTRMKRAARRDRAMELLADVGLADAAEKLRIKTKNGFSGAFFYFPIKKLLDFLGKTCILNG